MSDGRTACRTLLSVLLSKLPVSRAAWSDDKFELPTIHAKSELLLHGRNGNSD
jgi:hypothetical protein